MQSDVCDMMKIMYIELKRGSYFSAMWHCITRRLVKNSSLNTSTLEDETTMLSHNVTHQSPSDTARQPRRKENSIVLLPKPKAQTDWEQHRWELLLVSSFI